MTLAKVIFFISTIRSISHFKHVGRNLWLVYDYAM